MDESAVKVIVAKNAEALAAAMGLSHWRIRWFAERPDIGSKGYCERLIDYERATIYLDPAQMDDEADLLRVLRHELFHVVASPADLLLGLIDAGITDPVEVERIGRVSRYVQETLVRNLERLWDGAEIYWAAKAKFQKSQPKGQAKTMAKKTGKKAFAGAAPPFGAKSAKPTKGAKATAKDAKTSSGGKSAKGMKGGMGGGGGKAC